jgi:ribonuclease D
MEAYARDDTRHLKPLSDLLKAQLREKGRLAWLEESCDRLIAECAIPASIEPDLVWRIKGSHKLARGALAVLREIWRWREQEAVNANKPPYFVLSHEALVDISTAVTEHRPIDKLLPRHFSPRRRDGLSEAIQKGLALAPEEHPQILRHHSRRHTEAQRQRFLQLEERRNARARELDLEPTLIASRATMLALAEDWNANQGNLMKWQQALLSP